MGSARANQSPILYRISKVISRTHCHDLPFQESHNAVSIHQTTNRKRSCKYVYDHMSSILHQRCWVELATYFTPAQKHVGGLWHHTLGMIIQFHIVSVGYPVLTRLWVTCSPTKAQKTNYWTTATNRSKRKSKALHDFPTSVAMSAHLLWWPQYQGGKPTDEALMTWRLTWSLDDFDVSQKTSKALGRYPCVCIHCPFMFPFTFMFPNWQYR